jgi:hypothetical protein
MAKAIFNKQKATFYKLELNLRRKLVKCCILRIEVYGAKTWTYGE